MRSRSRLLLVLVSAVALLLGAALPASAGTAALSGTVTDAGTGAPLGGACVTVYTTAYDLGGSTCTDDAGAWTVDGLDSSVDYVVQVDAPGHVEQWAYGASSLDTATVVHAPGTVDVALAAAGTLTGTVRQPDGSAPTWAYLTVYDETGQQPVAYPWVDETGAWSADLAPATYTVQVFTDSGERWAPAAPSVESAQRYVVTAGESTTADIVLAAPTGVSGVVTDARTHDPVAGVCARLIGADGGWGGEACTGDDGRYTVTGATPGRWLLLFDDQDDRYGAQWYPSATTRAAAREVEVVDGQVTSGLDAALAPAAVLTGRAVDRTGRPMEGVCPAPYEGRTTVAVEGSSSGDCSGADGVWRLGGLPATAVTVQLSSRGALPTWAYGTTDQRRATVFTTAAGATTRTKDVRMLTGSVLRGTVRDARTGAPLAGMTVEVEGYTPRSGGAESPWSATTDAAGRYEITGVPDGTYHPVAYDQSGGYAVSWAGGATDRPQGRTVTVRGNQVVPQDFALQPGAVITGTLAGARPAGGAMVDAVSAASGSMLGYSSDVDPDTGAFTVRGLPATTVVLSFTTFDDNGEQHVFWYDGAATRDAATTLRLTAGTTTTVTAHTP